MLLLVVFFSADDPIVDSATLCQKELLAVLVCLNPVHHKFLRHR